MKLKAVFVFVFVFVFVNNIELAVSFCLEMEIMENSSLEDCRAPPPPAFLLLWIQIFSEEDRNKNK